jgi:hypothetical protein
MTARPKLALFAAGASTYQEDFSVMIINKTIRRWRRVACLAAACCMTAGLLVGCGDSDEVTAEDCSVGIVQYESLYTFDSLGGQLAEGGLGHTATSGAASVSRAPQACLKGATFALESGSMPAGLTLDSTTGEVAGTPTSTGVYDLHISVEGPLIHSTLALQWQISNPAAFAWQGWDDSAGGGHVTPDDASSLNVIGDALVLTSAGTSSLTTMRSTDGGATWTTDTPPTAPPARRNFLTADDGQGHLYVMGGSHDGDGFDDVWMFDGSTWQQRAAHVPFSTLDLQLMFAASGHLFVQIYGSLWRSDDGGQNWAKVAEIPFGDNVSTPTCGVEFGNKAVVVTAGDAFGTGNNPQTRIWSSDDAGVTWHEHTVAGMTGSPVTTLNGGVGQCAVQDGRLFVAGNGHWWHSVATMASTADLDHWDFQPRSNAFIEGTPLRGAVFQNGRLHVIYSNKLYTSQP